MQVSDGGIQLSLDHPVSFNELIRVICYGLSVGCRATAITALDFIKISLGSYYTMLSSAQGDILTSLAKRQCFICSFMNQGNGGDDTVFISPYEASLQLDPPNYSYKTKAFQDVRSQLQFNENGRSYCEAPLRGDRKYWLICLSGAVTSHLNAGNEDRDEFLLWLKADPRRQQLLLKTVMAYEGKDMSNVIEMCHKEGDSEAER